MSTRPVVHEYVSGCVFVWVCLGLRHVYDLSINYGLMDLDGVRAMPTAPANMFDQCQTRRAVTHDHVVVYLFL